MMAGIYEDVWWEEKGDEEADEEEEEKDKASDGGAAVATSNKEEIWKEEAEAAAIKALKKRMRKLKPSGVVASLQVDPEVSDEEDNVVARMKAIEQKLADEIKQKLEAA